VWTLCHPISTSLFRIPFLGSLNRSRARFPTNVLFNDGTALGVACEFPPFSARQVFFPPFPTAGSICFPCSPPLVTLHLAGAESGPALPPAERCLLRSPSNDTVLGLRQFENEMVLSVLPSEDGSVVCGDNGAPFVLSLRSGWLFPPSTGTSRTIFRCDNSRIRMSFLIWSRFLAPFESFLLLRVVFGLPFPIFSKGRVKKEAYL